MSRQWFRLLADRLDAVAVLYRVAAMVADADSQGKPVRVDHYRQGPYDMLVTLCGGRSVSLLRQGATLPSANLRYRLRTLENLPFDQRPMATLVLAFSDQANRRAVRTLGDPQHHSRTFVATEEELLAGDHRGVAWQQCGGGTEQALPVKVVPGVSLETIIARTDRLAERFDICAGVTARALSGSRGRTRRTSIPAVCVQPCRSRRSYSVPPSPSGSPAQRRAPRTCWPHGHCAPPTSWPG